MKSTTDILHSCPVRRYDWEIDRKEKRVVIFRPKYDSPLARKIMGPLMKNQFFRIYLDDLGSVVWKNCDGKTSVEELGKILAEEFGDKIEPIYERLFQFILQLKRQKFIELQSPPAASWNLNPDT